MKQFLKLITLTLLVVAAVVIPLKITQKVCWDNKLILIAPPSLDSWDPTERAEAVRQSIKKFGGK